MRQKEKWNVLNNRTRRRNELGCRFHVDNVSLFQFSFFRARLWLRAFEETRADADTVACPSHGLITRREPVEIARESVAAHRIRDGRG